MGVEDHFHSTGKKQHLDPGANGTPTPVSTSPPAKTPRKKGETENCRIEYYGDFTNDLIRDFTSGRIFNHPKKEFFMIRT
jgi:hypothetical protein